MSELLGQPVADASGGEVETMPPHPMRAAIATAWAKG